MSSLFTPFSRSRAGDAWFPVGRASTYPDITSADGTQVRDLRLCPKSEESRSGCKIFHVPKDDSSKATEVTLDESAAPPEAGGLRDQVMVFRYKGKFHAINHVRHSTLPSWRVLFLTWSNRNVPTRPIHSPTGHLSTSRTSA